MQLPSSRLKEKIFSWIYIHFLCKILFPSHRKDCCVLAGQDTHFFLLSKWARWARVSKLVLAPVIGAIVLIKILFEKKLFSFFSGLMKEFSRPETQPKQNSKHVGQYQVGCPQLTCQTCILYPCPGSLSFSACYNQILDIQCEGNEVIVFDSFSYGKKWKKFIYLYIFFVLKMEVLYSKYLRNFTGENSLGSVWVHPL